MAEFDNNLQCIVKRVDPSKYKKNPPTLIVEVDFNGKKYSTGVWRWTRKDGTEVIDPATKHPMLKGTLKEWDSENPGKERVRSEAPPGPADRAFQAAHAKLQDEEFEDDIPF